MPWFRIKFSTGAELKAHRATAEEATAALRKEFESPFYTRLREDMPAERRSGPVGEMGYYTPLPLGDVVSVTPLREVYQGGGYCLIDA